MLGILDLPFELFDGIVTLIDAPADVLSMSLTCKVLQSVIVPDQLHWRRICLYESDTSTLKRLARNRRLASFLRRVAINPIGDIGVTYSFFDFAHRRAGFREVPLALADQNPNVLYDTYIDAALLEDIAKNCSRLEDLRLNVYSLLPYKPFFRALDKAGHRLSTLAIVEEPAPHPWSIQDADEIMAVLGGHAHFAWESATIDKANQLIQNISTMLATRCPNLQSVSLYVFSVAQPIPNAESFFRGRWAHLRILSIGHVQATSAIGDFLNCHPHLEGVSIQCAGGADIRLYPHALSKLTDFDVVWVNEPQMYIQVVKPLSDGRRRPIIHLSVTAGAFREDAAIQQLCENLPGHTTIQTLRWEDTSMQLSSRLGLIGKACKSIVKLSILAFYLDRRLPEIAAALTNFPNLNEIRVGRGRIEEQHCAVLAMACPSLRKIGPWARTDGDAWVKATGAPG